jgi:hypothetical protein
MNLKKLKAAETAFLKNYPEGFEHPEFEKIAKKHRVDQMSAAAREHFAKARFKDPAEVAEQMAKLVGRSSLVSLFEKPKFRDTVRGMGTIERDALVSGLKSFLHGSRRKGFDTLVATLAPHKLAKWSLVTVLPNYYRPQDEVFVKPTTAKGVIEFFELENLTYKPTPTWAFYDGFRTAVFEMKSHVDASLQPNNAAFLGFLMMSMGSWGRPGPK